MSNFIPKYNKPEPSFGDKIYKGLAGFGRVESAFYLITGGIIAIVLTSIAVYLLFHSNRNLVSTTGRITQISCIKNTDSKNNVTYNCSAVVNYVAQDRDYNQPIQTTKEYKIDDIIEISYDPSKPTVVSEKAMSTDTIAYILLGVASLIVVLSYINYRFTQESDIFAAGTGTRGVINIFK
jgi:hypothetical protein